LQQLQASCWAIATATATATTTAGAAAAVGLHIVVGSCQL